MTHHKRDTNRLTDQNGWLSREVDGCEHLPIRHAALVGRSAAGVRTGRARQRQLLHLQRQDGAV